mmetsp:Transcript_25569/g.66897  ORF Transcript_25569/g.66897 Transcript_25569/m.66897 type:complete len:83 (+) Transcript_25569:2241-2489(+)
MCTVILVTIVTIAILGIPAILEIPALVRNWHHQDRAAEKVCETQGSVLAERLINDFRDITCVEGARASNPCSRADDHDDATV